MGLFDDAVPGGNITKPLLIALGTLLVGKMMSGGSSSMPAGAPAPAPQPGAMPEAQQGGLFGGLGGLLDRLSNSGLGPAVNSWVGTGQNQPVQPEQLNNALGQTTISDLARRSGMSEQELLMQLSRALPGVVDRLTPGGRIPTQPEVHSVWNREA